jgi:hypothetical protein
MAMRFDEQTIPVLKSLKADLETRKDSAKKVIEAKNAIAESSNITALKTAAEKTEPNTLAYIKMIDEQIEVLDNAIKNSEELQEAFNV